MNMLKKGGCNWVDGDQLFGREIELKELEERVRHGSHTLLTAQRRMGKTSLLRELVRRLRVTGDFDTVFVDVEAAKNQVDMVTDLGIQAKSVLKVSDRFMVNFANTLDGVGHQIERFKFLIVKVKRCEKIVAGNWLKRGDKIFSSLARNERRVVLVIDELPILVNRLLKDDKNRITSEGRMETDVFLSWLRRNAQVHQGRVTIIVSGSVRFESLLEQADLVAQANNFSTFDLKPWSKETAALFLDELSKTYDVTLPLDVRQSMCSRLRSCIPHHVQLFFDKLHVHLRRERRPEASLDDVEQVYLQDMLGNREQVGLQHYDVRLKLILGRKYYLIAHEILTHTATQGYLDDETVHRYEKLFPAHDANSAHSVRYVLYVLHHDGYLERRRNGTSRFESGFLEQWWRNRYGQNFDSVVEF